MPRDAAKRMKPERRWCFVNPEGRIVDGIMYERRGQAFAEHRINGFITERLARVEIRELPPMLSRKRHAT